MRPGFKIGNFVIEKNIGSGSFASVWAAQHVISKSPVAIKVIVKSSISSAVAVTRLQREIALLKQMEHPFIAEFFQVIENDEYYFLVMEYVQNGNLLDYVNNNGRLSEDQARRYFGQLVSVLEYLHEEKKTLNAKMFFLINTTTFVLLILDCQTYLLMIVLNYLQHADLLHMLHLK